jgi:hypothetical protein
MNKNMKFQDRKELKRLVESYGKRDVVSFVRNLNEGAYVPNTNDRAVANYLMSHLLVSPIHIDSSNMPLLGGNDILDEDNWKQTKINVQVRGKKISICFLNSLNASAFLPHDRRMREGYALTFMQDDSINDNLRSIVADYLNAYDIRYWAVTEEDENFPILADSIYWPEFDEEVFDENDIVPFVDCELTHMVDLCQAKDEYSLPDNKPELVQSYPKRDVEDPEYFEDNDEGETMWEWKRRMEQKYGKQKYYYDKPRTKRR